MADARTAILITLDDAHEGRYQDDYNDYANWSSGIIGKGTLIGTNGGITALDMPGVDIKNLTIEQKVAYYLENYWKPRYDEISNQLIASKLFDLGVLFGIGTAVKNLQGALGMAGAAVDGLFGDATLAAVNEEDSLSLLAEFELKMRAHATAIAIMHPEEAQFLTGWLRRINS